jgi:chemotaxis protein methyltransferase CheR
MFSSIHEKILEYFYEKTGIHFDEKKEIVAHKLDNFAHLNGFKDASLFFDKLKNDDKLWQDFVNLLTVNETYFFRETKQMEIMLSEAKKLHSFDVLCAPSSSGEEPYTILIMLSEVGLLPRISRLAGIDINSDVIEHAKRGVYAKRSLHRATSEVVSRYFAQNEDGQYKISDEIKKHADFRVLNIFDGSFASLGRFDFVFSRNMLIYFDKESRYEAEKVLFEALKPGGILFLGHADIVQNSFGLKKHVVNGVVYYQKD